LSNICFYTSDYGYGHAARDIAVIRGLLKKIKAKIFVKTDYPYEFMKHSLPLSNVLRRRNDIGVVYKYKENGVSPDKEETERQLDAWVNSWENFIIEECEFCKANGIDLILSDITPQPFLIGESLKIPSIAISNFTWHYIFHNLLGKTESVSRLEEAYQAADAAIVLPFNEEMSLFKRRIEVPLVSREITRDRQYLRREHGILDDELLIYLGVGKSLSPSMLGNLRGIDHSGARFLTSGNSALPLENAIKIPTDDTETQDYLAMSDLVVSKTGYSTASESIRGNVPMLLFRREGYEEDKLVAGGIEKLRIGKEISEQEFLSGNWLDYINNLHNYKESYNSLNDRFKSDGITKAIESFEELLS
jgi:hypothetical protein